MATILRFEDIDGWKKARELTNAVYRITSVGRFERDFALRDQIRRAAISVMANIAEGFGRGGNKEFAAFLSTARGSCTEVKSHLYVALDAGLIDKGDFELLYGIGCETESLISGLMRYLAASEARGRKFASGNREP